MKCKECVSEFYSAFSRRKFSKLRKIHSNIVNEYIENPNPILLKLAIVSYVLSKVLSKPRFFVYSNREKIKSIEKKLLELSKLDESNAKFSKVLEDIEKIIYSLEKRDQRYIYDLFTKGRIKVGAKLYAKGISLGKVSSITGIPKEEILSYAGKTLMFDKLKDEKKMKERIEILRRLIE